ncbi:MAG: HEPN domain-containing protein [Paludibaculum sp.]
MKSALMQFNANLRRASDLCGLASILQAQTTSAIDTTDILRAAMVLAVSAFDHFVHEITREGMLEIAAGKRSPTDAYHRFQVSLRSIDLSRSSAGIHWLDQEIRDKHGWLSFQDPDRVADALRNVTEKKIWEVVGRQLGISAKDAKAQLKLIVDRRNKIAHEADMDPTVPGVRWPITIIIVEDAAKFMSDVALAIVSLLWPPI